MNRVHPIGNKKKRIHTQSYYIGINIKVRTYLDLECIDKTNNDCARDDSFDDVEDHVAYPVRTEVHSTDELHVLQVLFSLIHDEAHCRCWNESETN